MHLPEDSSEYDAGVVDGGLCDDELEWFRRQRRDLVAERGGESHDAEDLVGRHAVNVVPARWWQRDLSLPFDEADYSVTSLSRDDVTAEARRCRESGNWLPLLVVSFAWGWGSRGFGPTRLSWVMRGGWRSPRLSRDEIERRLGAAIDVLDREGAPAAYELLLTDGRIPALGPAFFTKFLYFASRSLEVRCPALILDARLASAMRCFWTRRSDEPYAVRRPLCPLALAGPTVVDLPLPGLSGFPRSCRRSTVRGGGAVNAGPGGAVAVSGWSV